MPPWRQPRGKWMVSLVNSHTNATSRRWHLWEIDLRFAPGLPPGRLRERCTCVRGLHVEQNAATAQDAPPANNTRLNHNLSPLRPLPRAPAARRCPPWPGSFASASPPRCRGNWRGGDSVTSEVAHAFRCSEGGILPLHQLSPRMRPRRQISVSGWACPRRAGAAPPGAPIHEQRFSKVNSTGGS